MQNQNHYKYYEVLGNAGKFILGQKVLEGSSGAETGKVD